MLEQIAQGQVAGSTAEVGSPDLWRSVDRLVDAAPSLDALRFHRLQLLAARRWRGLGLAVPGSIIEEEHRAAVTALIVPRLLERIRAAYDGPIIVMKGPEIAARYPDPALRMYGDVDLLVDDAAEAHQALLVAGFELIGDPEPYVDIHHLRPLAAPGLPLAVEIHSSPKWPETLNAPPLEAFLSVAVPSSTGVGGVSTLPRPHHTLVLVGHAWAHRPLEYLRDLVDVAAMAEGVDRTVLDRLAEAFGMRKLWRTTIGAADAVLRDGSRPLSVRVWARHLPEAREPTVLESHANRVLSPHWVLPLGAATKATFSAAWWSVRPAPGEKWRTKLRRARYAVRDAFVERSRHEENLERHWL
jgi:putative nucleotidyltransferase-like protein